jgi:uncharacterized protein (DUF1697 family)
MNTYISMLRGINVGGQKKILMEELRSLYESLNMANVQTYVQSGNVVFGSAEQDTSILSKQIEAQIERMFGYQVPFFVRTKDEFRRTISSNPFLGERAEDTTQLYVTFLYEPPPDAQVGDLRAPEGIDDEFLMREQEIFLFCPGGYGRTKLNNNFFERKLKVPATTRNWKTVNALFEMANRE